MSGGPASTTSRRDVLASMTPPAGAIGTRSAKQQINILGSEFFRRLAVGHYALGVDIGRQPCDPGVEPGVGLAAAGMGVGGDATGRSAAPTEGARCARRPLVCGSRGYGRGRQVLIGSTSARLVDHAECPVLVVPRGAEVTGDEETVGGTSSGAADGGLLT